MKVRFIALFALLCLASSFVAAAQPGRRGPKARAVKPIRAARLVALLPASDGIVTFDAKEFLNDGLPRVLSANATLLGKFTAKLDEIQARTGIDLRKFDEVAVGLTIKQVGPGNTDVDGVAIASGDINAAGLTAVAKLASNGTYREEKIAGRTVYVFTVKDVANKAAANTGIAGTVNKVVNGITRDIAVAAYDQNSLVLGSVDRVRETLEGRSHPGADLTALLARNPSAIANFALKTPAGLSNMLPLGNDELGKNLRSIQYVFGSVDLTPAGASVAAAARTTDTQSANGLKATLDGLQMLGTALLGGGNSPSKQVYSRMIKSAKFAQTGNEVTLDLLVSQADIDTLISGIK